MTLVPVLLYHSVSDRPHPLIRGFSTTPADFEAHLNAIVERGLEALTVSGLVEALDAQDTDRLRRAVAITFDDGFADIATTVLPALTARRLCATVYVTTGIVGGAGSAPLDADLASHMLDWSQVRALRAGGVEIGAHSHSHPQLDTLSRARVREELRRPREILEDRLGEAVPGLAYPHGYAGPGVRRLAAEAGYVYACGVADTFTSASDDRFALSRLMLRQHHAVEDVAGWLDRRAAPPPRTRERARTRGWRVYRRTRSVLTGRPGADDGWPAARLPR